MAQIEYKDLAEFLNDWPEVKMILDFSDLYDDEMDIVLITSQKLWALYIQPDTIISETLEDDGANNWQMLKELCLKQPDLYINVKE